MPRSIDEPGGDYISVTVERNGIVIYKRDAVLSEVIAGGVTRWKVDDTDKIFVTSNQGPVDIARRMLAPKGSR